MMQCKKKHKEYKRNKKQKNKSNQNTNNKMSDEEEAYFNNVSSDEPGTVHPNYIYFIINKSEHNNIYRKYRLL